MKKSDSSPCEMPHIGLGLWKLDPNRVADIVCDAIEIGYRHLDSAADYGNEPQVGAGIAHALKEGHCLRDELWVTSKLWNTYHRYEHVRPACERSLRDLGLDYLDLYLIHFPIALQYVAFDERYPPGWTASGPTPRMEIDAVPLQETWRAMEELVNDGLVRYIGICNYNSGLLHDLMSYAGIAPANLQIESHPHLTQERLIRLTRELGLTVTAFSPLGAPSYVELDMATETDSVLRQAPVLAAADHHGRSPAQVVLRWGVQRGTAVIPKTSRPERLQENLEIFDFELNDAEMQMISALNRNRRYNDPGAFCEPSFGRFHPIYD